MARSSVVLVGWVGWLLVIGFPQPFGACQIDEAGDGGDADEG